MNPTLQMLAAALATTLAFTASADDAADSFAAYAERYEVVPEASTATTAEAGTSTNRANQAYTVLAPCRLLDTRQPSERSGAFAPREERSFYSNHPALAFQQGGSETACGVPLRATAIAINMTAVQPTQPGYLTAWAFGADRPLASSLNLVPGENLSNAITVPVDHDDVNTEDLTVYAHVATHLVADVVGYFAPIEREEPECYVVRDFERMVIEPGARRSAVSPACQAGHIRMEGWCELAGQEELVLIESGAAGVRQRCDIRNVGTSTLEARPTNRCCTVGAR